MSKFRRQGTGQSIKGKPISHPIPIVDDEFPIRTPGQGIALPLGENPEDELRMRESVAAQLENTSHQTGIAVSDFIDPIPEDHTSSVPSQPSHSPPEVPVRRSDVPVSMRNSTASKTTGSSTGKPQRKKSTMRAMFGKLFGKKRKSTGSSSSREEAPKDTRADQHRSDASALSSNPPTNPQKRSVSLPIDEFNRALRSHSIVADDFPLGSGENAANRQSTQTEGRKRPRRATTPSRLWTPTKIPGYVDWTGLSPRPSSAGKGSRVVSDAVAGPDIGTAVTSSGHPNRRSRSLGELRDTMGVPIARRRSDEIRYWRESYDQGLLSPMSSNKAEPDDLLANESVIHHVDVQEPPQPFVFEMAGMKITQAASLETRVQRLEERMMHMERMSGSRNFSRRSEDAMQFQDSPRRSKRSTSITRPQTDDSEISLPRHHRYRDPPPRSQSQARDSHLAQRDSQTRSSSYGSNRPSTISTHNSYHPSFDATELPIPPSQNTNFARPLSTSTTIRNIPSSSPTFTKDNPLTGEHYTVLTNMIVAEQTARLELENVVLTLQRQLQTYLSTHSNYPTPGSDARGDPLNATSTFEQDDSSEDDHRIAYDRDENEEVYQTPMEESGFGDEIFGDAAMNDHDLRKSAPRTLSLSQITLGRGVQQSVNF